MINLFPEQLFVFPRVNKQPDFVCLIFYICVVIQPQTLQILTLILRYSNTSETPSFYFPEEVYLRAYWSIPFCTSCLLWIAVTLPYPLLPSRAISLSLLPYASNFHIWYIYPLDFSLRLCRSIFSHSFQSNAAWKINLLALYYIWKCFHSILMFN